MRVEVEGVEGGYDKVPACVRIRYANADVTMQFWVPIDDARNLGTQLLNKIDWFERLMAEG